MTPPETPDLLPCPLSEGDFRINNGYLCNGTLRLMRADFDTNPSEERKQEIFDWIEQRLNTRTLSAPSTAAGGEFEHIGWAREWEGDDSDLGNYITEFFLSGEECACPDDNPNWFPLYTKTKQQKTAEPDLEALLHLGRLREFAVMGNPTHKDEIDTLALKIQRNLTAISTDNAKRGDDAENYEEIGRALVKSIAINAPDWQATDCPSDIVVDLMNQIADLEALTTTAAISTQRGDAESMAIEMYCQHYDLTPEQVRECLSGSDEHDFDGDYFKAWHDGIEFALKALTSKPETAGQEREGLAKVREALIDSLNWFAILEMQEQVVLIGAAISIIDRLMGGEGDE